jgi:RNA polymerase sigma-70 factor (ECF subfamily)
MFNMIPESQPAELNQLSLGGALSTHAARRYAYELSYQRVYAIAFWMTGNELAAEEILEESFRSAFSETAFPTCDEIDQHLVQQLRRQFQIPVFTLNCDGVTAVKSVRHNTLRVELERAVIELPATEKLIFVLHDVERYEHDRIARLLGITERESRLGLHQGRLRLREILSK